MFYICVRRFDVIENLEKFWILELKTRPQFWKAGTNGQQEIFLRSYDYTSQPCALHTARDHW